DQRAFGHVHSEFQPVATAIFESSLREAEIKEALTLYQDIEDDAPMYITSLSSKALASLSHPLATPGFEPQQHAAKRCQHRCFILHPLPLPRITGKGKAFRRAAFLPRLNTSLTQLGVFFGGRCHGDV